MNNYLSSAEVQSIPLSISLLVLLSLLTYTSISQQMVDKLNRKNLNFFKLFKSRNIHMSTLCNVQKYSVNEEQKRFYVQVLAPWEAQVKKELGQSFVINAWLIKLILSCNFKLKLSFTFFIQAFFLIIVHEIFILFLQFIRWRTTIIGFFLNLIKLFVSFLCLSSFLVFTLQINFPVLFSWFNSWHLIKVQNQTLLNSNV